MKAVEDLNPHLHEALRALASAPPTFNSNRQRFVLSGVDLDVGPTTWLGSNAYRTRLFNPHSGETTFISSGATKSEVEDELLRILFER